MHDGRWLAVIDSLWTRRNHTGMSCGHREAFEANHVNLCSSRAGKMREQFVGALLALLGALWATRGVWRLRAAKKRRPTPRAPRRYHRGRRRCTSRARVRGRPGLPCGEQRGGGPAPRDLVVACDGRGMRPPPAGPALGNDNIHIPTSARSPPSRSWVQWKPAHLIQHFGCQCSIAIGSSISGEIS